MRPWIPTTAAVLGALAAFMAFAAWQEWPWWEYAFLSDGSPVAWLSSALLVANAAVALSLATGRHLPVPVACALSSGLAFLAIDEQFQLHERLKEQIGPGTLANLPILAAGIIGVVCVVVLTRALPRGPARVLLWTAIVVGLVAIWIDVGTPPALLARLEEAFEVASEGLFLCGLLEAGRSQVQSVS